MYSGGQDPSSLSVVISVDHQSNIFNDSLDSEPMYPGELMNIALSGISHPPKPTQGQPVSSSETEISNDNAEGRMSGTTYPSSGVKHQSLLGLHRFQILPILQVSSTAVRCIHKCRYRYRYMEIL